MPLRFALLPCLFVLTCCALRGQDTLVVLDDLGTPAAGASVELIAPVRSGSVTDIDGRFVLPAGLVDTQLLRLSYVGYRTDELRYGGLRAGDFRYVLEPDTVTLREYILVAAPYLTEEQPGLQVRRIERGEIETVQPLTTADALADLSGVYVQKSQFGGGSPVVRGFEANRVLLLVDGVRLNNAIFRSGHLQNAISVDPTALESISVVSGPGALSYGTDAIGGVIHFRTLDPVIGPLTPGWIGEASVGAASAARSFTPSVRLRYHGERFATVTLLSASTSGHLRAGAHRPARFAAFGRREQYVATDPDGDRLVNNPDPDRQIGTAYDQFNLTQKFRFALNPRTVLTTNFQYSTTSDVPRYDALTERAGEGLRWARWDYGPQTRWLAGAHLKHTPQHDGWIDRLEVALNHQVISEDRLLRRFGDPLLESSLVDVNATTLTVDLLSSPGRVDLRYGADLRYDAVDATASFTDVFTGWEATARPEPRYPGGGSSLTSAGAYVDAQLPLGRYLSLRAGLRASSQRLRARFTTGGPVEWPATYLEGSRSAQDAVVGTTAVVVRRSHSVTRGLLGQSFRAPNVDDFAKFRERNGFVSVPNPDLRPERAVTAEIGYRRWWGDERQPAAQINLAAYHTWLNDAIVRAAGSLPDGRTFFVSRGDTLGLQTNVNAESARVYGLDLSAHATFRPGLRVSADVHYLVGRRRQLAPDGNTLDLPQDHLPPPYGRIGLRYEGHLPHHGGGHRISWNLRMDLRGQAGKAPEEYAVGSIGGTAATGYVLDRRGTADNLELTPRLADGSFAGSYGWWTANLYLGGQLTPRLRAQVKLENILDRHYRTFASGVSAAGRNLGLTLTYRFWNRAQLRGVKCV